LDLSILNQKGTPMFNSDIFANRPTFGIPGRIFISTDTLEIYRDTGSSWTLLSGGGGGGGTINGTIAAGQVAFGTAANTIGGTNNLYWDNASTFLGINTNTPNNNLVVNTIVSDGGILLKQNNTSIGELIRVGSNNYSKLLLINAGVNNIDINSGGFSYIRQNNFAIGSNTDTGERLQVTGTMKVTGASSFGQNMTLSLNQNGVTLLTVSNTTNGTNSLAALQAISNGNGFTEVGKFSQLKTANKTIASGDGYLYNNNYGDISILNDVASGKIKFAAGGSSIAQATLFSNGNFAIATTTDTGQRLQVNGSSLFSGDISIGTNRINGLTNSLLQLYDGVNGNYVIQATTANDTASRIRLRTGSSSADRFVVLGNGNVIVQSGGTINDTGERFQVTGNARVNGTTLITAGTISTGSNNVLNVIETFAPSSGGDSSNLILINPIIDQTGTANGTTRGIFINPTLTGVTQNWHSVQWQNSIGWGLYGAGTASNYINGNLQLGSLTPIGSNIKLQVTGIAHILDNSSYTSGTIQSFVVQKNLTINSAISGSSGICNYVSTGDNLIASSQSVPDSTSFANIYAFNKYQFNSPALTLTATQASPGVRTITQLFTQNVFKGTNSGTITHMSGVQIGGYYNDNTGTITPVITNAYQLLINDTGAYGHTFTFTNRWGIYQEGINDRNYLAGNLMLNSTTDTGQILQVTGAIRVNGQASGSAGGNSGNHLIINVDGTSYKIALLNP